MDMYNLDFGFWISKFGERHRFNLAQFPNPKSKIENPKLFDRLTIFSAASAIVSAEMIVSRIGKNFSAFSTLVPCMRTTSGTDAQLARGIDDALRSTSQRMMPPKILISTPRTAESASRF
jgi:hypothetical protein